jgi:predicted glycosyltransferase
MSPNRVSAWVDLVSPSHPFFFNALLNHLPDVDVTTTVREKTETVGLTETVGFDHRIVGRDFGNGLLRKVGIPLRTAQLTLQAPAADVSLSSRNAMCILASKARGIPSIHFTDNDITAHVDGLKYEELYNRLEAMATHNVVPSAFETDELIKRGADPDSIHTYDGYKEDIYIADFEPDPAFEKQFPFEEYIVVRPEALGAAYVDAEQSLVPELLAGAAERDLSVIYLPRGRDDEKHVKPYDETQVYAPDHALDGLQLAWHAKCMLTGSGTMAREAACMGKPSVSFFPNTLLSVDQEMVSEGRVFHSRESSEIIEYVDGLGSEDVQPDISRSKQVAKEVSDLSSKLIHREKECQ